MLKAYSQPFINALHIPPVVSGAKINLTEVASTRQFYPGIQTKTWGYNGDFLGPTLVLNQGDSVNINVLNNLTDTTTVHWHGLLVPPIYDGGPHNPIPPGDTWSVYFRIKNQASTHWYHPHGNMKTTDHVTRGLAGMILIKDTLEAKLKLPRTYGVDDIPVILQDRRFDSTGNFLSVGLGDSMLVNGTAQPRIDLPAQVVRLRNLNASAGRFYNLGFNDNRNFYVIASDASMLEKPYQTNRIMIGVGERYEILVDLSADKPGDSLFLMSYGSEMGSKIPGGANLMDEESPLNGADFNIMKIDVVTSTASPVTSIPATLIGLMPIDTNQVKRTRWKSITGHGMVGSGLFHLNGVNFDMNVINDTVVRGSVEKWTFTNSSNIAHPIHIHGVSFYILDINGNSPPPYMAGWKDVFIIRPIIASSESVTLIMKFDDYADHMMPYMYHCHLLPHEDMGMMHSFLVVDPTTYDHNDHDGSHKRIVFPNPSNGKFTFEGKGFLSVFNMTGEKIIEYGIESALEKYTLDLSNQSAGIYILRLETGEHQVFYEKLILMK